MATSRSDAALPCHPCGSVLAASVRARTILQCTNMQPPGLPGAAARGVRDSLVPLMIYQMATDPLSDAAQAQVLPGGEAFSDTRNNLLACRWDVHGGIVTGGMPFGDLQDRRRERLPGVVQSMASGQ